MGKFRVLKNSLLGGQVSRNAVGRTDLPQYAHSSEILQNMIPLLSGGAYRRPGTLFQDYISANINQFVNPSAGVPSLSSPPRIFPFVVSQNLAYAIVISTDRWSSNQDPSINPAGSPGGATMRAYRTGANTTLGRVVVDPGRGQLPYRCKSSQVATTGTDQCIYSRQGGPGAVANTGAAIDSTPILDVPDSSLSYDDDIWQVQFCQANDVMFLTHADYPPQTIWVATLDNVDSTCFDFGLTGLALCQSRPYLNQNSTAATMSISWTGSTNTVGTITSSVPFFNALHGPRTGCQPQGAATPASGFPNDAAFFALAVGIGGDMTGNNTDNGIFFAQVISVTDSTHAVVHFPNGIPSNYSKSAATTSWWESAWSNYRGWPRACGIFEGRLCFASTLHQPSSMWFTQVGAYGAPVSVLADATSCKFTSLGDGPNQGFKSGTTGTLANGRTYSTPHNWVFYPVDDSQGDGQSTGPLGLQPFRISLATTSLDAIQYLSPDQQLFIGTASQEWVCTAVNGSFDVANSSCSIQSHYGSDNVQAIRIGYELMFVHQKKDEVRAYQYNYYDQSFFGEPVQLFFDEYPQPELNSPIFANGRKKYRQMDWDADRSTLWCIDTQGNWFGLLRDRKLAVTAWHTHQMGGFNPDHGVGQNIADNSNGIYTDAGNFTCDGSVISVASTPSPTGSPRDVWLIVKRSVNDTTVYSVERMVGADTVMPSARSLIWPGTAREPLQTDCSYTIFIDNGDPANLTYTIGLQMQGAQLQGTYYSKTWGLFALTTQGPVDASGHVVLQAALPPDYGIGDPHMFALGYNYSSIIQPVRIDPPSQIGTSQGAIKRPSKAYLRLFKTLMLKMGAPGVDGGPPTLEIIKFKQPAQLAMSPEIYTGDKEVFLPTTFTRDGYVYIVQDQPLPFTLVSVSIEGSEYEQ